jgi:hypothetical protein
MPDGLHCKQHSAAEVPSHVDGRTCLLPLLLLLLLLLPLMVCLAAAQGQLDVRVRLHAAVTLPLVYL